MTKPISLYVNGICLGAILSIAAMDWSPLLAMDGVDWLGFSALVFLAIFSESLAISLTPANSVASITFLPLLTCVLLFGPAPAVPLVVVTGLIGERVIRKKAPVKAVFNVSQWIIGVALGGAAFVATGGVPLATSSDPPGMVSQMLPFALFGITFLVLNNAAVIGAIALSQNTPVRDVLEVVTGKAGGNLLYDLLVSPIALGVAFLYLEIGWWGILIALLPLLFIRHAYLTAQRLQRANRDLLSALVKAIETRDPYTSGHSVRVADLSRRIAGEMGLSRTRLDNVETAALLHDVGKIDPVYVTILKKPGSLSAHEREVIESHVLKGVELLEQLSSVSAEIIADVRHHHERVDGKGYPDRLSGKSIPLGARIIKVCDAVDAMLSDRPYRKALSLQRVREQLSLYSGTQFDEDVVDTVLSSNVLESHVTTVIRAPEAPIRRSDGRVAVGTS